MSEKTAKETVSKVLMLSLHDLVVRPDPPRPWTPHDVVCAVVGAVSAHLEEEEDANRKIRDLLDDFDVSVSYIAEMADAFNPDLVEADVEKAAWRYIFHKSFDKLLSVMHWHVNVRFLEAAAADEATARSVFAQCSRVEICQESAKYTY